VKPHLEYNTITKWYRIVGANYYLLPDNAYITDTYPDKQEAIAVLRYCLSRFYEDSLAQAKELEAGLLQKRIDRSWVRVDTVGSP
jgi:hypothetical protein